MKDYPKLAILMLLLLGGFSYLGAQRVLPGGQIVVFQDLLDVTSAPANSAAIQNIGQAMHTLFVNFPDETTSETALELQFQVDYGSGFRPFGPFVTDVPVLSNGVGDTDVYRYNDYYGVFRGMRVRYTTVPPADPNARIVVKYIGQVIPVVPFVTEQSDRFSF